MPSRTDTAGPATHARAVLAKTGESLLWAAFGEHYRFDFPGLDESGALKAGVALQVLDAAMSAASDALDEGSGIDPDVIVFGPHPTCLAMKYGEIFKTRGSTYLWILTPQRIHVALRDNVEHSPEQTKPAEQQKRGFLRGLPGFGKDKEVTNSADKNDTYLPGKPNIKPLRPIFDIPRAHIVNFSVATRGVISRRPCLRLELTDRSGFDFFFRAGRDRGQYERLLALTLGAPE